MDAVNKSDVNEAKRLNESATRLKNTAKNEALSSTETINKLSSPKETRLRSKYKLKGIISNNKTYNGGKPIVFNSGKYIDKNGKLSIGNLTYIKGVNGGNTSKIMTDFDKNITLSSDTTRGYTPRYVDNSIKAKEEELARSSTNKSRKLKVNKVRSVSNKRKGLGITENLINNPNTTSKSESIITNTIENEGSKSSKGFKLGTKSKIGLGLVTAGALAYGGKKLWDKKHKDNYTK